MQVCTRCKKEFEEEAHLNKQGHPFCDACYHELTGRRKDKQTAKSSATPCSPEGRSGVGHSTQSSQKRIPKILIGVLLSMFLIFALLVLAAFLVPYFKTPPAQRGGLFSHRSYKAGGGSMEPTIKKGGRFIVNHDYYKSHRPARWDIVVFRQQESDKRMHTSRIVALGGESIEIRNGKLRIDGSSLTPPPEVSGAVYVRKGPYGSDEYGVPEDHFYVLGDNGNNSKDSRYLGAIPSENLIGKVIEPLYLPKRATPLIAAVREGKDGVVKSLLAKGVDVNAKDKDGRTALMWAISEDLDEISDSLIAAGTDVNTRDNMNRGALMYAVWKGNPKVTEILLSKGADVNQAAVSGETPLMSAAYYGHIDILKMLLDEGADVNARTVEDKTALNYAINGGHADIVQLLKETGTKEGSKLRQSGVYVVYVNDVVPGGQAEKLGIQVNDRIVEYDGEPIQSGQQLAKLARDSAGRPRVGVMLERKGQLLEIEAKGGVLGIIFGDRLAETMEMFKQAEKVTSKSPLHEFLNQYLSWFRHPGAKSIEPQAIASDAISTWSDGRVLRGREEHIREMKQGMKEIREAFQLFKVTAHDITFELDGDMGWISCRLHREGILKKGGEKFSKDGRTTLKLKRNGDIWQLVEELSTLDNP